MRKSQNIQPHGKHVSWETVHIKMKPTEQTQRHKACPFGRRYLGQHQLQKQDFIHIMGGISQFSEESDSRYPSGMVSFRNTHLECDRNEWEI